ncbi:TonB protein, C-terminal domain protein [Halobacteriovorax sp. BALOs_7]|uniref:Energy transducer TonB n=1 Tax=Halobacteriovorax vibrionivorans TaxID=2152716 RepID=A0ABY0IFV3_9BACT|nr:MULTISPECIES: energy transducer TonB [Halobacteriovorax]AYF43616.1 TonB protein, C-terminal domain protein [Halobacteriovorax sp. BALOs_7]RZF21818.1 energy transducer TonB [Halobacteriovorax vibrionivorans]TGD48347.1 energy transducer TonB [Halobacteriovorax sp. Y22]
MRKNTFLYTAIISAGLHGLLLFASSTQSKEDSANLHYSKNQSQRIQVKRIVKIKNSLEQKVEEKVVKKAKKVVSKKRKVVKEHSLENAPNPKKVVNSGQETQKARYLKRVRDEILARKRYPKIAKMLKKQGVVDIYFEVSYPKNLSNIRIKKGSGHAILDKSALETIEDLNELPEMPDFLKSEVLKIAIPIKYELL